MILYKTTIQFFYAVTGNFGVLGTIRIFSEFNSSVVNAVSAFAGIRTGKFAATNQTGIEPFRMARIDGAHLSFKALHFSFHLIVLLTFKHIYLDRFSAQ
jgi:hypothetical protein